MAMVISSKHDIIAYTLYLRTPFHKFSMSELLLKQNLLLESTINFNA
jgi:hypothetical protein